MEPFSESQSSWTTFQDLFQDGNFQSSLVDMLSVINTVLKIYVQKSQVISPWLSLQIVEPSQPRFKFTNLKGQECFWVCITPMSPLLDLLMRAFNMLLTEDTHFIWAPRTLSWRDMMVDSRTFSRKFINLHTKLNSSKWVFGTSIDLLMIWLLMLSKVKVVMFGPARIMTVMSKVILSLKDMVPLD